MKIPEDQYFVRHSVQPVRRRQPRHVQSHLNLPFFPRSEARFEPRWVVFSGSTCLNVLLHFAACGPIGRLDSSVGVWLNRCTKKDKSSIRIRLINASKAGSTSTLDRWGDYQYRVCASQKWRIQKGSQFSFDTCTRVKKAKTETGKCHSLIED